MSKDNIVYALVRITGMGEATTSDIADKVWELSDDKREFEVFSVQRCTPEQDDDNGPPVLYNP
jgi:hypothetical protein